MNIEELKHALQSTTDPYERLCLEEEIVCAEKLRLALEDEAYHFLAEQSEQDVILHLEY